MAQNTTHVGAADSIVLAELTTMRADNRKGSPSSGVFSPKREKTHHYNGISRETSMRVSCDRNYSKEYAHA